MKRTAGALTLLLVASAVWLTLGRRAKAKDVWYHASNVAMLATTGRPQLVEFFHPD